MAVSFQDVSNKKNRKLSLIKGLPDGPFSQKEIQARANLSKGTVSKTLKRLENLGYLVKIGRSKPQFWEITPEGKRILEANVSTPQVGVSPKEFRLHNFSVQIPILKDTSIGFWEKEWNLGNWTKQFRRLQDIGVSVERTTKSLTINFQPRECRDAEIFGIAMSGTLAVAGYLAKEGIELDLFEAKVSRQEYASPEPAVLEQIERGMTHRQSLGRLQERIMAPDTPKEAFVWFDASKGKALGPERDTNDRLHMRNTALMPERVAGMEGHIKEVATAITGLWDLQGAYHRNLDLHMKVMQDIRGMVKKLNSNLDQRRLGDFLRGAP